MTLPQWATDFYVSLIIAVKIVVCLYGLCLLVAHLRRK